MVPCRAALLLAFLFTPLSAEGREPKAMFQDSCAVCHGLDGSGRAPNGTRLGGRNLADARWLARQENEALILSILRGRGAMPGFRRQLSEAEVRRMVQEVIRQLPSRKRP